MKGIKKYFNYLYSGEKLLLLIINLVFIGTLWPLKYSYPVVDYSLFLPIISIFIGFNITFLSIMTLSKYSKTMSKKETTKGKYTITHLENMLLYYKAQIIFSFIVIIIYVLDIMIDYDIVYINCLAVFLLINWFWVTGITFRYTFAFIYKTISYDED